MSDIASLRGMPEGLVGAYQKYLGQLGTTPAYVPQTQTEIARLQQNPQFLNQYQQDINYLRETPGKGQFEQSFMTQAQQNIDQRYEAAKQNLTREAARLGQDPTSGLFRDQFRLMNEAKANEMAQSQRQLEMWRMGEQRSRFQEARQLEPYMQDVIAARQRQALGYGQNIDQTMLQRAGIGAQTSQQLEALEQARRGQARGVESALDQGERQRLMDVTGFLQAGQPSATAPMLGQQWAQIALHNAGLAGADFGQALGGAGSAYTYWQLLKDPNFLRQLMAGGNPFSNQTTQATAPIPYTNPWQTARSPYDPNTAPQTPYEYTTAPPYDPNAPIPYVNPWQTVR
jgi:hypothetical protein